MSTKPKSRWRLPEPFTARPWSEPAARRQRPMNFPPGTPVCYSDLDREGRDRCDLQLCREFVEMLHEEEALGVPPAEALETCIALDRQGFEALQRLRQRNNP